MEIVLIIVGVVAVIWFLNKKLTPVAQQARLRNLESQLVTISDRQLMQVRSTVERGAAQLIAAEDREAAFLDFLQAPRANVTRSAAGGGRLTPSPAWPLTRTSAYPKLSARWSNRWSWR